MNFAGTGKKLSGLDLTDAAFAVDLPVRAVATIVHVEAASYGFDDKQRPRILFEPHVFYRNLAGAPRARAVAEGLAYSSWGTRPYPRTSDARYDQLERARAIDPEAAHRSISVGLGQVLGENYSAAGYPSAISMFLGAQRGERRQLDAMLSFIVANGIDIKIRKAVRDGGTPSAWRPVARAYNGPAYEVHDYHGRLSRDYLKDAAPIAWAAPADISTLDPATMPLLTTGMSDGGKVSGPIHFAQRRLAQYGEYGDRIDGAFGPKTADAVSSLQEHHPETGLVDGIIGKGTWAILLTDPSVSDPPVDDAIPPAPAARPVEKKASPARGGGFAAVVVGAFAFIWKAAVAILVLAGLAFGVWLVFHKKVEWIDRAGDKVISIVGAIFKIKKDLLP